jgi:hypothetical protein
VTPRRASRRAIQNYDFGEVAALAEPLRGPVPPPEASGAPIPRDAGDSGALGASAARSQRIRDGMAAARARGVQLGRPPVVDADQVLELAAAGRSLRRIAGDLEVSVSSVRRVLGG